MIDLIFKAVYFFVAVGLGFIPAMFSRKFKSLLGLLFGLVIAFAALYDYSRGGNIIIALAKYTILLTIAATILFHKKVYKIEDALKKIEYLEGKIEMILELLKEREILVKKDPKEYLSHFGENFEKVKEDKWFEYYKVWGSKGEYIVKIDKETGIYAGAEKVSKMKVIFRALKIAVPILIFLFVGITAWNGYKAKVDFSSIVTKFSLPILPHLGIQQKKTKNCTKTPMEYLLEISKIVANKEYDKIRPIEPNKISFLIDSKNITMIVEDVNKTHKRIEILEEGVSCGWIIVNSSMLPQVGG